MLRAWRSFGCINMYALLLVGHRRGLGQRPYKVSQANRAAVIIINMAARGRGRE